MDSYKGDRVTFSVEEMTEQAAMDISMWRYDKPYDVYNSDGDAESYMDGLHYVLRDTASDELVTAFVAVGEAATLPLEPLKDIYEDESYTDVAIGLRPSRCGSGLGRDVLEASMAICRELFPDDGLRITVAKDNIRAVKLYEKAHFTEICSFGAEIIYIDSDDTERIAPKQMMIMICE